MFHALLICSDGDCGDSFEAWGTLDDLETLACDCGCALQLITLESSEEHSGEQLELEPAAPRS
jgi:hypothetical protein